MVLAGRNSSLSLAAESESSQSESALLEIFMKFLKECLEEQEIREQKKFEQAEKKLKYQQRLLLDKYLEGIIEEPVFKEKQHELQRKLENRAQNSPGNAHAYPSDLAEDYGEERLRRIGQFLEQNNSISKACAMCRLEAVEKIMIYPDHLELVRKDGKSIIAVKISDMLY